MHYTFSVLALRHPDALIDDGSRAAEPEARGAEQQSSRAAGSSREQQGAAGQQGSREPYSTRTT